MNIFEIVKALANNQKELVFSALLLFIIAWIYKEVRNNYIDNEKTNFERSNKALEAYGDLINEIYNYMADKSEGYGNLLDNKFAKAYPFFSIELLNKALEWKAKGRKDILRDILTQLNEEVLRIKRMQKDPVAYQISDYSIDKIEYFFHSTKVKSFLQPIKFLASILTSTFVIVISTAILYDSYPKNSGTMDKLQYCIHIISFNLSIWFYSMFCIVLVDFITRKRFINNVGNWMRIVIFIALPSIILLISLGKPHLWYSGILSIVLEVLYINYLLPKVVRKSK